jgi:hypothetical protein
MWNVKLKTNKTMALKKQIILQQIPVKLAGGYTHFEITIPNSVSLISAVTTGVNFRTLNVPAGFANNYFLLQKFPVGSIRLQGGRPTNWFYDGMVRENIYPVLTEPFFVKSNNMNIPFSFHNRHKNDLTRCIPAQTRITGFYKDNIGKLFNQNIVYTVTLTLTIQ